MAVCAARRPALGWVMKGVRSDPGALEVLREYAGQHGNPEDFEEAIAQVEALVRVATESERLMRHAARCDRVEVGPADELREALAPFTPGQDLEGGGNG